MQFFVVKAVLRIFLVKLKFIPFCLNNNTEDETSSKTQNNFERIFFLVEHIVFTIAGIWVIIIVPGEVSSWYLNPKLCWEYPPVMPSITFHYYYLAKMGTHTEDLLFRLCKYNSILERNISQMLGLASDSGRTATRSEGNRVLEKDVMMDIHHVATAVLCFFSYLSRYYHIGSLVMLLHDISDIPLDALRICQLNNFDTGMYVCYGMTISSWLYYRIWFLTGVVIWSIWAYPNISFIFPCDIHTSLRCKVQVELERYLYVVLLGSLQVLHILWFRMMIQKGWNLLMAKCKNKSQ